MMFLRVTVQVIAEGLFISGVSLVVSKTQFLLNNMRCTFKFEQISKQSQANVFACRQF